MYSNKSDLAGPFSGCISAQPLISINTGIGSNAKPINIIISIYPTEVLSIKGNATAEVL